MIGGKFAEIFYSSKDDFDVHAWKRVETKNLTRWFKIDYDYEREMVVPSSSLHDKLESEYQDRYDN